MKLLFPLALLGAALHGQTCDLSGDGKVDTTDTGQALAMLLGTAPCSATIVGVGVCNIVVLQRVVNASLPGGTCLGGVVQPPPPPPPPVQHSVTLSWVASPTAGVSGYRIYRGTVQGGPYTQIASVGPVTTYTDSTVTSGGAYVYTVAAFNANGESAKSNEARAAIPTP